MDKNLTTVQERDPFNMSRCPASIDFGQYDIQTWYSAPYPQEYARSVFIPTLESLKLPLLYDEAINIHN